MTGPSADIVMIAVGIALASVSVYQLTTGRLTRGVFQGPALVRVFTVGVSLFFIVVGTLQLTAITGHRQQDVVAALGGVLFAVIGSGMALYHAELSHFTPYGVSTAPPGWLYAACGIVFALVGIWLFARSLSVL